MTPFVRFLLLFLFGVVGLNEVSAEDLYPQVSRILAQHCLECHGPDAEQRQADLRLDNKAAATRPLASGATAILPGHPDQSELLRRIRATDESRMPPSEAGRSLRPEEVRLLRQWIDDGANWSEHWSLRPAVRQPLPAVKNKSWVREPLDRFVLHRIETVQSADVTKSADRRTLIRRAYFDLIGLPPTPQDVADFEQDQSPEAWKKVVDKLLASSLYGQRWGRHWLDVVRYGDSNGSDENHPYPHAWRYRNYAIDALNVDLPFDQFVREQLAGDLLASPDRKSEGLTATGFLAIGTKILAEKDPVKKQADIVDEQIDTIGKALLGFTVACARCHDHKFDPIPTRDYYALAGILHSTKTVDGSLSTDDFERAKADHAQKLAALDDQKRQLEARLGESGASIIDREAEAFVRGNAVRVTSGYGEGIGIVSDNGGNSPFAEWDFQIDEAGDYVLQFRYAAANKRPGPLTINGTVVKKDAVNSTTGGWHPPNQQWMTEGKFSFRAGENTVRFESGPCMSHIDRIRLIRASDTNLTKVLTALDDIEQQRKSLAASAPQPGKVMAVADTDARNVNVHLRGSHLQLGDEVPRGFPAVAASGMPGTSAPRFSIEQSASGRRQLAEWMTDPENGAGRQLARVVVNRVWQWHFGRGIVATPNNYGLQGERPTHPKLLDWLTMQFIDDGWSLKALHRQILNSATWRQQTVARPSEHLIGFPRRRMEAEVIRDTLLFHSGRLDITPATSIDGVTSQNPSPEDLRRNEEVHRKSTKRSVYLPVVRSNAYRFFTLFDFPNATTSVGRRDTTTVPTQALMMMNDPFLMDQAERFAARVRREADTDSVASTIYSKLFNRAPSGSERNAASNFVEQFVAAERDSNDAKNTADRQEIEADAWAAYCHTLMTSSEFIYVD